MCMFFQNALTVENSKPTWICGRLILVINEPNYYTIVSLLIDFVAIDWLAYKLHSKQCNQLKGSNIRNKIANIDTRLHKHCTLLSVYYFISCNSISCRWFHTKSCLFIIFTPIVLACAYEGTKRFYKHINGRNEQRSLTWQILI